MLPLRQQLVRWSQDCGEQLHDMDPEVPQGLGDRAGDNWRALIGIADLAGGDWPRRVRETALKLSSVVEDDSSSGQQLLADIRVVFAEKEKVEELSTQILLNRLTRMAERPWLEWKKGRGLSARDLARLLEPFGIRPRQTRINGENRRGYRRKDFEDTFTRYLPDYPLQPLQANKTNNLAEARAATEGDGVADKE